MTKRAPTVKCQSLPSARLHHKQQTITSIVARLTKEENEAPSCAGAMATPQTQTSTRLFPCFPNEHLQLKTFIQFLESVDGRCRSKEQACAIATSISKFLKHAGPRQLDWDKLLQPALIRAYLNHLSTLGASGVDGQLTFLQRVDLALRFLKLEVVADEDERTYHHAQRAQDRVAG